MAQGDIVILRKPFTFDETTSDGVNGTVLALVPTFLTANYDKIQSRIVIHGKTKDGITSGTIIYSGYSNS